MCNTGDSVYRSLDGAFGVLVRARVMEMLLPGYVWVLPLLELAFITCLAAAAGHKLCGLSPLTRAFEIAATT
jgi:hypothetical protein